MNRRRFLSLLGLTPIAPLAAKPRTRYVTPAYFGDMPPRMQTITVRTSGFASSENKIAEMILRHTREVVRKAIAEGNRS